MKGHNIKELLMPNRETVKYIAVIAMVIDHIAYMFMPGPSIVYSIESFYVAPVTVLAAAGVFLVPLLIECFYTSKQLCGSRKHRRFFYMFYPVHFLVLILIKYLTSGLM